METCQFTEDVQIFCVTAAAFPDGVMAAFQQLHQLAPFSADRKFISISRPEKDKGIVYRAGATELVPGDLSGHGLQGYTLKKGKYAMITIPRFMQDLSAIGKAFSQLTALPGIDPEGYCLEWYYNKEDVRCMIRMED